MPALLINPQFEKNVSSQRIITDISVMKKNLGIEDYDFTIVIEDNAFIHRFNKKYLGIDAPTDVLAFPANEINPESKRTYLGDILISFPIAKKQADDLKHDIFEELMILIVHGLLHLLGYDHKKENEKKKMFSLQYQTLKKTKIPFPIE